MNYEQIVESLLEKNLALSNLLRELIEQFGGTEYDNGLCDDVEVEMERLESDGVFDLEDE